MGGTQTFLAMAAISIFLYMGMNVTRVITNASQYTNDNQTRIEAVNYGLSLSDELSSQAFSYDSLDTYYGNLTNVNNPLTRKNYVTPLGDSLFATIELSAEQAMVLGVNGRLATITVFRKENEEFKQMSQHVVSIIPYQ